MEGLNKIINSKSKTFLAFCFCFIAGAGAASLFDWPYGLAFYFYISLFLISFFLIVFWNNRLTRYAIFCLLFLAMGMCRFAFTIPNCSDPSTLCYYNGRSVTLAGYVSAEPDRRVDGVKYTIDAESITVGAENFLPLRHVSGRALITTRLYPEYHYGDTLQIKCKLQKPESSNDSTFRYDKYLARYGVWSTCGFPIVIPAKAGIQEANTRSGSLPTGQAGPLVDGDDKRTIGRFFMTRIFAFKSIVQTHLNALWAEPESSFMAGILFGSKSGLPPDVTDAFNKTGVTHIIAVSGFNVTIIVVALMFVLIRLGLYRQHAFWVVVVFIILFVLFTGATASVVRAGCMGLLVLVAQQIGRLSRITNVLILSAAFMLLSNPYLLVWDAGFQLSFLATIGLVYVSPVLLAIERKGVWQYVPTTIWETFIQTMSAIIATLPLILYQFGRLSIVAPLVNVLVLWIIAWLMLGGFVSLVLSFVYFPVGQWAAYITGIGLKYVLFVVEFFGRQSWAAVEFRLPLWGMVAMYCLFIYYVKIKNKNS